VLLNGGFYHLSQVVNCVKTFDRNMQHGKTRAVEFAMNEAVSLNMYFFIRAYSDAKAQIAAFIYATHPFELVGAQLAGNLKLAFVVDKETGLALLLTHVIFSSRAC